MEGKILLDSVTMELIHRVVNCRENEDALKPVLARRRLEPWARQHLLTYIELRELFIFACGKTIMSIPRWST